MQCVDWFDCYGRYVAEYLKADPSHSMIPRHLRMLSVVSPLVLNDAVVVGVQAAAFDM